MRTSVHEFGLELHLHKMKFFALELFVVVLLLSLQYMPLLSRKFYSDPARPASRYASAMKIRTRQSELLPKLMEQQYQSM